MTGKSVPSKQSAYQLICITSGTVGIVAFAMSKFIPGSLIVVITAAAKDPDGDPVTRSEWIVVTQPPGSSYKLEPLGDILLGPGIDWARMYVRI